MEGARKGCGAGFRSSERPETYMPYEKMGDKIGANESREFPRHIIVETSENDIDDLEVHPVIRKAPSLVAKKISCQSHI